MKKEITLTSALICLTAETHIHSGIGQSTGALDLPVARERATQYPFIPGSGVKGALRVWSKERSTEKINMDLFGKEGTNGDIGNDAHAGQLLCSDARLLLLPVRCMSDAYKWVTCPAIINRLIRDFDRCGFKNSMPLCPDFNKNNYLGQKNTNNWLGLEEREFEHSETIDPDIISKLKDFIEPNIADDLERRLVILSDADFIWFAKYALPVAARNALNDDKVSGSLWYQETLAPDTIMYCLFGERKSGAVKTFVEAIQEVPYVQIGGNETIGQGWFKMHQYAASKAVS